MGEFIVTTREDINKFIIKRQGEKKLGENVQTVNHPNWEQALAKSSAKFVLFGIPENIGCRSNDKFLSTEAFWLPFLHTFLNLEDTATLKSESILQLVLLQISSGLLKGSSQS
jgi:formiminoglutamase